MIATAHLLLGERDRALEGLERAVDNVDAWLINIRNSAVWDPLRGDRRFQSILRRLGVAEAGAGGGRGPGGPDRPGEGPRSIAVLPFRNLMGDAEQDYFVEGVTETLGAELNRLRGLRVKSQNSARRYKDTDESPSTIASLGFLSGGLGLRL